MLKNLRQKIDGYARNLPYGSLLTKNINSTLPLMLLTVGLGCSSSDFRFANDKIVMDCLDCEGDKEYGIVEKSFQYQTKAYDCLEEYLDYAPGLTPITLKPVLYYELTHHEEPFTGTNVGYVNGTTVYSEGFFGYLEDSTTVESIDDLCLDLHETMHVFTNSTFYPPSWFSEGMSIQVEERMDCDENQFWSGRMTNATEDWFRVLNGNELLYGNSLDSDHMKGAIFFAALEEEFGCDYECAGDVWNALRETYRGNEDLTTEDTIMTIEDVLGEDLSFIAEILEIVQK